MKINVLNVIINLEDIKDLTGFNVYHVLNGFAANAILIVGTLNVINACLKYL